MIRNAIGLSNPVKSFHSSILVPWRHVTLDSFRALQRRCNLYSSKKTSKSKDTVDTLIHKGFLTPLSEIEQNPSKHEAESSNQTNDTLESKESFREEASLLDAFNGMMNVNGSTKTAYSNWKSKRKQLSSFRPAQSDSDEDPHLYHQDDETAEMKDITRWKGKFAWDIHVKSAREEIFGLNSWRGLQLEAINSFLNGQSVFVNFPTGGGKSLCFQIPAICTDGLTVVVSPLISLITDQLQKLSKLGIPAAYLTSALLPEQRQRILEKLKEEPTPFKVLFVTPERVGSSSSFIRTLQKLLDRRQLSNIVIDEAHCISEWGHDFRPDYRKLSIFQTLNPPVPIMCLTASATPTVKKDILNNLNIKSAVILQSSYNRPNLYYEVTPKSQDAFSKIAKLVKSKYRDVCGLIYCLTTKDCEKLSVELQNQGVSASFYHGMLSSDRRALIQKQWTNSKIRVLCTTVAFGLGIDKPDIRYVIHHTMPTSLESYYQQTGRAGRDGRSSDCVLFFKSSDRERIRRVHTSEDVQKHLLDVREEHLDDMFGFAEDLHHCRRQRLLEHFGEFFTATISDDCCDNCSRIFSAKGSSVVL